MFEVKPYPWQRLGVARGEIITKLECLGPIAQHFVGLFFKGNLPTASTTTSGTSVPATLPMNNCTEEEFVCRDSGHCIQMIQKCDFRPDCSDKSDESACGKCTKSHTLLLISWWLLNTSLWLLHVYLCNLVLGPRCYF